MSNNHQITVSPRGASLKKQKRLQRLNCILDYLDYGVRPHRPPRPVTATVRCNGSLHRVIFDGEQLHLQDHPDWEREMALVRFGSDFRCLEVRRAWWLRDREKIPHELLRAFSVRRVVPHKARQYLRARLRIGEIREQLRWPILWLLYTKRTATVSFLSGCFFEYLPLEVCHEALEMWDPPRRRIPCPDVRFLGAPLIIQGVLVDLGLCDYGLPRRGIDLEADIS